MRYTRHKFLLIINSIFINTERAVSLISVFVHYTFLHSPHESTYRTYNKSTEPQQLLAHHLHKFRSTAACIRIKDVNLTVSPMYRHTLLTTSATVLVTSMGEITPLLLVTTALVNTVLVEETEVVTYSVAVESALHKSIVLFVTCMTGCSATSVALFFFCPLVDGVLPCLRCFSC